MLKSKSSDVWLESSAGPCHDWSPHLLSGFNTLDTSGSELKAYGCSIPSRNDHTDSLLRAESRYEEFIFQNTVGTFFFGKHQIPHPASVKYKQDEINHLLTLIINGFSITFIHVTFAKCWTAHFGRKHFISTSYLTWTYEIIIRNSDHLLYTSTGKSSPRKDWDWSWMLSPAVLL